jgi:outer membrane cobalamin receptor
MAWLAIASPVWAQARIEGLVVDPAGQPVAGAAIVAARGATTSLVATTDASGRFAIDAIPPGNYAVSTSVPGLFGEQPVVVVADRSTTVTITMRVSAVRETVVVSAAQVDQPLSRTADSVTVIPGHELDTRQVATLGAALSTIPGFTIARSGGPGTLTSVFPRGGESDFTLVLVDGIRANAFGGGLDFSQVPLADVDRIEVVRGPQSAIHGGDAIGGVVQVITRHGGVPSVTARVEGGSRNTRRVAASTTGSIGSARWQAGGDLFEDDGFTGVAPASGERVGNDDAQSRHGWVGGGWRARRGTDVQATLRYVDTDRGAPGPFGSDPAGRFAGVDRVSRGETERMSLGMRIVHPWSGPASRVRQRIDVDVADLDLTFVSPFGVSDGSTRRVHGRVQTDAALDRGLGVSGGVEWLSEEARSTFITSTAGPVPVQRDVVGSYGEARWSPGARVSLQAGLRAEHIARQALAGVRSAFSPRPDFPRDAIVSINPKVALSWQVQPAGSLAAASRWTRVRASAGTGIRPPDAFEIAFTDNPGLRPERSRSFDVGVSQALAGGTVLVDAAAFFNEYDDLIVSVGSLRDVSRYRTDNVSNARARGVELSGSWQGGSGISARAAYTWLDAEIRAVDGSAAAPSPYRVGDRLLRRPRHQGSATVVWMGRRAQLFATFIARGATLDAEPAFGPSGGLFDHPGFATIDAGGSVRLFTRVDAFARVLNLFDRTYEEVLGYPSPGRTAFVGVRIAARR